MSTVNINLQAKDLTASGGQGVVDPTPDTLVQRTSTGAIKATDATTDNEAVNKGQMDNALDGKVNKTTAKQVVYARDSAGKDIALSYDSEATVGVAVRGQNGVLKVGTPVANNDATTKEYVDNAIATAPTGGWTTILDKTWTEDETTYHIIDIDIPAEYQKPMSELRMTYYNNTPQAGAVYSVQNVDIGLYDGEKSLSFMFTGGILPTQDTKEVNVNFASNSNKTSTVLGNGTSDLFNDCYGIYVYKDSNGNAVQPIPTDPNALLNTSKIIGSADGNHETVEYILNTCLPNRSHRYTTNSTQVTVNYTSNDYYNDQLPECIISQVLTSTDETNLPVGSFICVQRQDLKFALNVSISFTSTASVSYKNVVTRQASIVGESMQVIAGAESIQNQMTSFDDISRNGNPLPSGGYAYYSYLKNGYPTKVYLFPRSSTSAGVTANKIYAGSRLVLQVRY